MPNLLEAKTRRAPLLKHNSFSHTTKDPRPRHCALVVSGQLRGCQYGRPSSMPSSMLPTSARGLSNEIDVIIESRRIERSRRAAGRQAARGPAASRSPHSSSAKFPDSPSKCSAQHPKIALWRNIPGNHSQNLARKSFTTLYTSYGLTLQDLSVRINHYGTDHVGSLCIFADMSWHGCGENNGWNGMYGFKLAIIWFRY